jgi:heptosyltransferase-1
LSIDVPASPTKMRVLIVKLSSLGDVVHTLPVAVDIQRAFPHAHIDWVVERSFAPLVSRCQAVSRVIPIDLRQWRRHPFASTTRQAWQTFREALGQTPYDAVLDLQGLTKSAWVSWLAKLSPQGQRYAMANKTDGSGYERPTRWVADVAIAITPHIHALARGREVAAEALGYDFPARPDFGFHLHAKGVNATGVNATGVTHATPADHPGHVDHPDHSGHPTGALWLVHGTSRADKEWPFEHWVALGRRLQQAGHALVLPQGNAHEAQRAQRLAQALPGATVLPALSLDALTEHMATSAGVIGVDSGLSHIAVALDLPHVQIYNFDTAWRTGPIDTPHQHAVFAKPAPSVDAVWQRWLACQQAHAQAPGGVA